MDVAPRQVGIGLLVVLVAAVGIYAGMTVVSNSVGVGPATATPTPSLPGTPHVVTVSGRIVTAEGSPATNDTVVLTDETDGAVQAIEVTDGEGAFSAEIASHTRTDLQYYQARDVTDCCAAGAFPRDGSPDVYPIDRLRVANDTALGTVRLPAAHPLAVVVRNEEGERVANATVAIRYGDDDAGADGGVTGTTTDEGRLQLGGAAQTGIEVAGTVTVAAGPPGADGTTVERTVTVEEERSVTLTVGA